jgi:hypothetical protein
VASALEGKAKIEHLLRLKKVNFSFALIAVVAEATLQESNIVTLTGRNYYRYLLVQGFTNIDNTFNYFTVPTDITQSRLRVEVHYYHPYDLAINTNTTTTQ